MLSLPKSALWYAQKYKWKVFPLRPRTKEPFANLGVYNATDDCRKVAEWWQRWPKANIGLHCGGSQLLALDIDEYKDSYDGDKVLTHLDEETLTSLTGGGGTHLLYSLDNGRKYGNDRGDLPPGLDIRGWGGYVVLPPSVHPSGNRYTWELGYGPHEREPLPLPDGLANILETSKSRLRTPGPPDLYAVEIGRKQVISVLQQLELLADEGEYMRGGRKWILRPCPFQPEGDPHADDRGAYIVIMPDGHIAAGCHHERCRELLKEDGPGWPHLLRKAQAVYA